MASKSQPEEQGSCETANADDSSKRSRLPETSGEGTSGLMNISNQHSEDVKDSPTSGGVDEDNASSEENDDAAGEDACDRVSRFPSLIQDQVFGFLGVGDKVRMAQVCSSWSEAVFRPCHWSHSTVKLSEQRLSEEYLKVVNERGICQVNVSECNSKEKMKILLQSLPSLSSLELVASENAGFLFEAVSDVEVPGLESLRIECETSDDEEVPLALPQSFRSFCNLQAFSFTGMVGSEFLEVMGRELPRLQSLSLFSTVSSSQLSMRGLENFSGLANLILSHFNLEAFENLTQLNRTLRELRLKDCEFLKYGWPLVLSQMSSLEQLNLTSCNPEITDTELQSVCENLVNLKKFAFSFADKHITDRHLKSVAKLSGVQDLALSHFGAVTDESIGALGNLPHLKSLQLEDCGDLTSRAMEHISGISSLQDLCLITGSHGSALLETLRRGSCKLKQLTLVGFKDIKGEDMAYIAEMSSLRKLHLWYVSVGPTGMELLSQGTFTLEDLSHCGCDVTIEGLMPLFERQTCLRSVSILEKRVEGNSGIDIMRTILPNLEKWRVYTIAVKE